MSTEALAHIERILGEAHQAAADVMHARRAEAQAHLAKAALAVAAATKALERRKQA